MKPTNGLKHSDASSEFLPPQPPVPEQPMLRIRDFSTKVLVPIVGLVLTILSMAASALWGVYSRPTESKVQRMLDRQAEQIRRGFLRIEKRLDRHERRMDRLSDRVRYLEKRK